MPKIINHEKYRKELTCKALNIFRKYGYSGLGMRKIAEKLGISKSALYHYFPSKDALFEECTKSATSFESRDIPDVSLEKMSHEERIKALMLIFQKIEKEFKGELSLLIDYIRPLTPSQVADDTHMQYANKHYKNMVAAYVGETHAQFVLCLMYGVLLQRLFDGGSCSYKDIEEKLLSFIKSNQDTGT